MRKFSLGSITIKFFFRRCLLALSFWVLVGLPVSAQELESDKCYSVDLPQDEILWPTDGVWTEDDDFNRSLLVVDTYQDDVLRISADGQIRSGLKELVQPSQGISVQPLQLTKSGDTYWLHDLQGSSRFWTSEGRFRPKSFDPSDQPMMSNGRVFEKDVKSIGELMAIYRFSPMADGILAFGDLQYPDGSWQSGFVYFDDIGRRQLYRTMDLKQAARNHYVGKIFYLASIGESGYVLLLEDKPTIVEVRADSSEMRELEFFPKDFQRWLDLESHKEWRALTKFSSSAIGPRKATLFYKILETEPSVVAGLYSWRDHLYLLGRRRLEVDAAEGVEGAILEEAKAEWWLMKLDPRDGEEISRVKLPTDAAHLTVVPGEFWALIERNAVQPLGELEAPYMRTDSMKLVPAGWIEDSALDPVGTENFACVKP